MLTSDFETLFRLFLVRGAIIIFSDLGTHGVVKSARLDKTYVLLNIFTFHLHGVCPEPSALRLVELVGMLIVCLASFPDNVLHSPTLLTLQHGSWTVRRLEIDHRKDSRYQSNRVCRNQLKKLHLYY